MQNETVPLSNGASEAFAATSADVAARTMPLVIAGEFDEAEAILRDFFGEVWDGLTPEEQAQVRMIVDDMIEQAAAIGATGFIFASGAPPPDRALDPIFGPPPILDSEDADAYEALHDRVRGAALLCGDTLIDHAEIADVQFVKHDVGEGRAGLGSSPG